MPRFRVTVTESQSRQVAVFVEATTRSTAKGKAMQEVKEGKHTAAFKAQPFVSDGYGLLAAWIEEVGSVTERLHSAKKG